MERQMTPIIDEDLPRARVAVLLRHFAELDDSRESWRVMYPLKEVLLLVSCAMIASCDDFDEIAAWGEHHLDFLRRLAEFHHGIPCERWLRHLFNRVDPTLFARCFESWVAALWPGRHEFIAIDGKTARRTHDRRKGLKALHTLSAYAASCASSCLAAGEGALTRKIGWVAVRDFLRCPGTSVPLYCTVARGVWSAKEKNSYISMY